MSNDRKDVDRVPGWLEYPLNKVQHKRWQPDYSFADLISLFVVKVLLRKGVKPRRIRDAEIYLRESLETDRPFLSAEIKTDGMHVWWRDKVIAGQIEAADMRGQQAMREIVSEQLETVRYKQGWARWWQPQPDIAVDPRVQFGEPVIAHTRLTAAAVASTALKLGTEDAAYRFSISAGEVASAVKFQKRVAAVLKS